MNIIQLCIVILACFTAALTAGVVELQAKKASSLLNHYANFNNGFLAGVGDLALTTDIESKKALILQRDSSGAYHLFAQQQLNNDSIAATSNGGWFGSIFNQGVELFRVGQNGQAQDYSTLSMDTADFVVQLQGDGSLVVVFSNYILTFEFINSAWTVTQNSTLEGVNLYLDPFLSASLQSNALVLLQSKKNADETYNIYIITRQSDKSWKIVETLVVNKNVVGDFQPFYWDGANTLVTVTYYDGESTNFVYVFNKGSSGWEISQTISSAQIGITGYGYFGAGPLVALDNNNVLVPAPADGVTSDNDPRGGSVYLMQRNQQNQWNFIGKFNSNMTLFGAGMAKNDHDVLTLGCVVNTTEFDVYCSLFTIPVCVVDPIDVTCSQKQDTCSTDLNNLLTVNNPSCGPVTSTVDRVAGDLNGISVHLTISRPLVADAECTVTLVCSQLTSVSPRLLANFALLAALLLAGTLLE